MGMPTVCINCGKIYDFLHHQKGCPHCSHQTTMSKEEFEQIMKESEEQMGRAYVDRRACPKCGHMPMNVYEEREAWGIRFKGEEPQPEVN